MYERLINSASRLEDDNDDAADDVEMSTNFNDLYILVNNCITNRV